MRQSWIVKLSVVLMAVCALAQSGSYQEEREFFEKSCYACHEMKFYLWPRTQKSWELTVENMRRYVNDDTVLGPDECRRIADFLAAYAGEGVINVPPGVEYVAAAEVPVVLPVQSAPLPVAEVAATVLEPVAAEPLPAAEVAESVEVASAAVAAVQMKRAGVARSADLNPLKGLWNPGRSALKAARLSGFLAVASLAGLLISGFGRRKLKLNFRRLHVKLALVLFVSLSLHGIIYLFEYGTPGVLWYWFGFAAFTVLIVTELQGIVRKRFRKGLLISHIIGACAGLALSLLHWIWAWL